MNADKRGLKLSSYLRLSAFICGQFAFFGLIGGLALPSNLAAQRLAIQRCPEHPEPSVSRPEPPADVCIPAGFRDVPIEYFDDYSWRLFVAMVWPAEAGRRGVPDLKKTVGSQGPRVFETGKSLWEVFHDDGSTPAAFDDYDAAKYNACKIAPQFGDLILASTPAYAEIGQAGNGELTGPLIAQNGRYVHYQTLYNRAEFERIVRDKLYLRSALPDVPSPRPKTPVIDFPFGSIALKAAWLEMDGFTPEQARRYYTRPAYVLDPAGGKCSRTTVGLVALHIVQKTPSRPQWIWSSFEQVDNAPPARMDSPGRFAFHDGSAAAMPGENPALLIPLEPQPAKPFNVVRSTEAPIHPKTALANLLYERLLKGTVWENYQLVVTQWPRLDGDQSIPVPAAQNGDVSNTFPGADATSAFANLVIETFDQARPQLGCMSCHNRARMTVDFMWSVFDHAYPANFPPAAAAVKVPVR
jgi:hypothetical protein